MAELDEELAEATDDLLGGRVLKPLSEDNRELVGVVRQLYIVIDPKNTPSAEFRRRLDNRLNSEWDRQYAPKLRLVDRPAARVLALAAAVVLVLAAVLMLAVPSSSNQLNATAIGFGNVAAVMILALVALVGAFLYWRGHR
ncbi:MAG TPA: hypothetical protein VHD90_20725 [Phototrophicaceae bacterium]|nr:hypothetical protein [Phototrophicaceae bacterium]